MWFGAFRTDVFSSRLVALRTLGLCLSNGGYSQSFRSSSIVDIIDESFSVEVHYTLCCGLTVSRSVLTHQASELS